MLKRKTWYNICNLIYVYIYIYIQTLKTYLDIPHIFYLDISEWVFNSFMQKHTSKPKPSSSVAFVRAVVPMSPKSSMSKTKRKRDGMTVAVNRVS